MKMRWLAMLLMCAAWFGVSQPAHALGCILLGCSCNVVAADIAFDDVNPLTTSTQSAEGQVSVSCTGLLSVGAGVRVEMDDGIWGSYAARRMKSEYGDFIDYNITIPNNANVVWGDGASSTQWVTFTGGLINLGGWSASRNVTATMTTSTSTKPGRYEDTVVVRIVW